MGTSLLIFAVFDEGSGPSWTMFVQKFFDLHVSQTTNSFDGSQSQGFTSESFLDQETNYGLAQQVGTAYFSHVRPALQGK